MQWRHFVPAFDRWFNDTFARQWGEANNTKVIVDNVGYGDIAARAAGERQARRGHDLIQFVTPHSMLHDEVVDHRDVFEECARRYGQPSDFAVRTNYNPKTHRYVGFAPAFQPALAIYRKDLWNAASSAPHTWGEVLTGARRIKLLHDKQVGISLASEHNAEQTLRSIMYSFGSSEQDVNGNPALTKNSTVDSLKYVKELFEQSMAHDVLSWDGASNNRFMLTGEGCFTVDSLSILRASETIDRTFNRELGLASMPAGPSARLGSFGFYNYAIWSFAENIDGAKRFLADYVGASREAFLASGFQNMPCYPETVRDLAALTTDHVVDGLGGRYAIMKDVSSWTTNVGYPGYTNPAIAEVYERGIISKMFAGVATGRVTPDAALDDAMREVQSIFQRWKERGLL